MSTSIIVNPHIYKKGKILNFKKLNEGKTKEVIYAFSNSKPASLTTIANLGNNLNQITGRCLLGIFKLLSYFGLSKDPSEQFSKDKSVYGKFYSFLEGGDNIALVKLEEIITLLVTQNAKIEWLEDRINHLSHIRNDVPISRNEVLDFTSKLNEIEEHLRKILG